MANNNKHTGRNVPALRFPEFSGEWLTYSLGEIADVTKLAGYEFTKYVIYEDEGSVIALRGLNCKNGTLILDDVKYIDHSDLSKLTRSKLYIGDILYTYVGTVGEVAIITENDKYYLAPNVSRIRVEQGFDSQLIKHLLSSNRFYKQIVLPLIATSSQPALSMENIRKFQINVPNTIQEQKHIATILTLLEERINTQSKIIEELKTLRSALRYKLLHEMMVERMAKLGELCRITTGKLDANAMVEGGSYPFFTCAEQVYEIDRYAFDTEALLVSGNGANLGYIHYYCGKFNAYQRTYVLSDFSEDIQYLRQYLEAYLSKRIESEKNTGNTPYIVLGTLADMEIKLPRLPEQQRIAHDLSVLSQKIENETHMFELFIQEKKTLLCKMFI